MNDGILVPLWGRASVGIPVVWSASSSAAAVTVSSRLEPTAAVFPTTIAVATSVVAHARTLSAAITAAVSRRVTW